MPFTHSTTSTVDSEMVEVHLESYVLLREAEAVEHACVLLGREDPQHRVEWRRATERTRERLLLGERAASMCDGWSAFVGICTAT